MTKLLKKFGWVACLFVLFFTGLGKVFAEGENEFIDNPYHGVYIAQEPYYIKSLEFSPGKIIVTFNADEEVAQDQTEVARVVQLQQFEAMANWSVIDSSMTEEKIKEERLKAGFTATPKEAYEKIAKELTEEMDWAEADDISAKYLPEVRSNLFGSESLMEFRGYRTLPSGENTRIEMLGRELFLLSPGKDDNSFVDQNNMTFVKQE